MCRVLFSPPSESFFSLTVFFFLSASRKKKKKKKKKKKEKAPLPPSCFSSFSFFFSGKKKKKRNQNLLSPRSDSLPDPFLWSCPHPLAPPAPLLSLCLPLSRPLPTVSASGPLPSALGWGLSPDVCHKLKRVFKLWQESFFLPSLWLILMTRVFFVSFPFSFLFLLFLFLPFFLSLPPLSKVRLT